MSYIVEQSALNGKPVMGVSINYRLAAFGFLDSEEVRVRQWHYILGCGTFSWTDADA
jgi:triacylglycerol lipase